MNKTSIVALCVLAACSGSAKMEAYKCGDKEISFEYVKESDEIRLVLDGSEYVLTRRISASGAKYAESDAENIVLWNKGNDNSLYIGGTPYPDCVRQ